MGDALLVLRGLWFRRWVSLAVLVVSALVVGGAVTGPLFLRAAGESVLRDNLNEAAPIGRAVDDRVVAGLATEPLVAARQNGTRKLERAPTLRRLLVRSVDSLSVPATAGVPNATPDPVNLAYRQGMCAHVRMVRGSCSRGAGEVMVSASVTVAEGWRVGRPLLVDERRTRVSGVYVALDPGGDYWSGGGRYFAAYARTDVGKEPGQNLDAVFAPRSVVEAQPGDLLATGAVDRYLDVSAIRLGDVPALQRELTSYANEEGIAIGGRLQVSDSAISAVLSQALRIKDTLRVPVLVVELQLLLLSWLILFLVVANAAEARGPEVALAKLRGVPTVSTVAFGLLDIVLLVALAVPLGFGLALGWVTAIVDLQLAPGTPVIVTRAAGLAAVGAGAGAALAAALAASRTLRRPVVEQWRRATRRAAPRSWLVDGAVVVACVAGLVLLARAGDVGSTTTNDPDVLALVAPGLLVLAAALLGSRGLLVLCRSAYGLTRRRGAVGAFLAVRQLARRPSTLRLALVLAVAFGLMTFAIDAWSVSRTNQHDRAWTEIGAAQVLTVLPLAGRDLGDVVDQIDPSGGAAAAVSTVTDYSGAVPTTMLAVQPERFARVAFWRADFGQASLASLTGSLTTSTAPPVPLSGDRLRVRLDAVGLSGAGPPVLVADVAQPGAGRDPVSLGSLRAGTHELQARIPCERQGCWLAGLHLERPGADFFPFSGSLRVRGLDVHAKASWREVPADLAEPSGWRAEGGGAGTPERHASGLLLPLRAGGTDLPTWRVADRPRRLPALVTREVAGKRTVAGVGLEDIPLEPVSVGPALPGAGSRGVVVDRDYAQRFAEGATTQAIDTVWLSSAADAGTTRRLERAGVTVLSRQSSARLTSLNERRGPALAIFLFVAGAALGALLAAGGVALTLHLAGRRRGYELAAMSALGVRRAVLLRSLCVEQGLLVAFGIGVGVLGGLVGAVLALPSVPEFADVPTAPPQLCGIHTAPVLGTVLGAALVLALVIAVSSVVLLRSSRYDQLREAPA